MPVMMKCGHAANATQSCLGEKIPVCAICTGIVEGWNVIDENPPSLEGRLMICAQCRKTAPSSTRGAFFEHRPEHEMDRYYDGCRGWD